MISRFKLLLIFLLSVVTTWCYKTPHYGSYKWINKQPRPPVPAWPDRFTGDFYTLVEKYGEDFHPKGTIFYDWTKQTFRADFYEWCVPLFDSGSASFDNYTCSYLATEKNMYFINHTANSWGEYDCCMFEAGLGAVAPDWMKAGLYNGTDVIANVSVDVWWFPGSYKQVNNPCFGYWSARDSSKRPVQFFGITNLNQTVLQYYSFKPGEIPININFTKPNTGCDKECMPPTKKPRSMGVSSFPVWPKWPTCSE